ncbi:hypothetical protein FC820_10580 [Clostridium sporogenes]|uniref:hypothetical protein n=1 Tax=Clostridium sporogenes TaxID=1509 RepID=UPI0013CFBEA6|nr:hypothetical protein [Clostridium sporogenes]EJE7236757.1 hypothetical protein [Clostridium botulinum]NFE80249.1 hypothetical protein [Clostridium sporogenes]NFG68755.1 hypothetical protein [Clostridium sporogenes]
MKDALIGGVAGAIITMILIIIISIIVISAFIKKEIRQDFILKIKKAFKKDKLKNDINKLKQMNNNELINLKYFYIKKAKSLSNAGSVLKNSFVIITIVISLISITIPITIQFTDTVLKDLDTALTNKIEIIKQEEISANKKAEKIQQEYVNFYTGKSNKIIFRKELYEKILNLASNMFIGCIVLSGIIFTGSISYSNKASHYETLVMYIDNELIKK